MSLPLVFVSYSHLNEAEKNAITGHLNVLANAEKCDIWYDDMIEAGEFWLDEILEQINRANIAVLLVTAEFLNSKFISKTEVPLILAKQQEGKLRVFPIIAKPCAWKAFKWLNARNVRPKNAEPIWGENKERVDTELAKIVEEIAQTIEELSTSIPNPDQEIPSTQVDAIIAQEPPNSSTHAIRVLYVDDTEKSAIPIKEGLELSGMEVVLETNPTLVNDHLNQAEFDVILIDMLMPQYRDEGIDICVNILAFRPNAKIILISGNNVPQSDIADGFKRGAADFISRDFDIDDMTKRIRRVVANKQPRYDPRTVRTEQIDHLRRHFETQERRDLRGRDIEALLKLMFEDISGVAYQQKLGLDGSKEEVSLVFENKSTDRFWRALGDHIWVAVRPWSPNKPHLDLATFRTLIPDEADTERNLGIVITPSGYNDDVLEYVNRKNAANTFPLLVPLTLEDLDTIINSEKYEEGLREAVARWLPK